MRDDIARCSEGVSQRRLVFTYGGKVSVDRLTDDVFGDSVFDGIDLSAGIVKVSCAEEDAKVEDKEEEERAHLCEKRSVVGGFALELRDGSMGLDDGEEDTETRKVADDHTDPQDGKEASISCIERGRSEETAHDLEIVFNFIESQESNRGNASKEANDDVEDAFDGVSRLLVDLQDDGGEHGESDPSPGDRGSDVCDIEYVELEAANWFISRGHSSKVIGTFPLMMIGDES